MTTGVRPLKRAIVDICVLTICLIVGQSVVADELDLENGITLSGLAVEVPGFNAQMQRRNQSAIGTVTKFWMVDDGVRRYFVNKRIVSGVLPDRVPKGHVTYELSQKRTSRRTGLSVIGGFTAVEPFDQFGRRTVMIQAKGEDVPIIQGITKVSPDRVKIESINKHWEYFLDTKVIPPDVIQSLIEQASDRSNPDELKAAFAFYSQAKMFPQASQELDHIANSFPELQDWSDQARIILQTSLTTSAINELQRREDAGQRDFAYQIAKGVDRNNVEASVFRAAQRVVDNYEQSQEQIDEAILALDSLQADLDDEQSTILRPLRAQLADELDVHTITRLEPFLRSLLDDSLESSQKLALAYSSWILGDANAVLNLDEAILLWKARFFVREFLLNEDNPIRDDELIDELTSLEYIGIERISQLLKLLQPIRDEMILPESDIGVHQFESSEVEGPVTYSLKLPPEYSPNRAYPVLVTLRSGGRTAEGELRWWAGDEMTPGWASRRGYLVIAPEYADPSEKSYDGNTRSHEIVVEAIKDLRKRYRVDSDRIFLAGHGMGADLCFDLGMSRTDIFAGIIPITGQCSRICDYYKENAPETSWYVVAGERDRNTLGDNQGALNSMMNAGQDMIYCEYKDRGYESYYEETEKIFKWMELQRRASLSELTEWDAYTLRSSEDGFYWVESRGIKEELFPTDVWTRPRKKKFSARVSPGGTIRINGPVHGATVWLAPEIFDFDDKCKISLNSRRYAYRDFVKPSIKAMLEHFREHADTGRLYWAKIEI